MPAAFVTAYYQSTGKSVTVHGHAGAIEPVGFPSFSSFLHSALHCVVIFVTAVFSSTPKTISITWCVVRTEKIQNVIQKIYYMLTNKKGSTHNANFGTWKNLENT